jgi:hypothetical protein
MPLGGGGASIPKMPFRVSRVFPVVHFHVAKPDLDKVQ